MIVLAGTAVAVGALIAVLLVQRLDVGESWEDWSRVESPRWFTAVQVVLVAMFFGGLFASDELAAVLVGVPAGACLVFLAIGLRRRFGRDTRPTEVEDELEEEPESWRSRAGWFAASWAVALIVGYLIDLRGLELVAVSFGLSVLVTCTDQLRESLTRRIAGR
ncbi:MAG TPA: hypothetical protein VNO82_14810 [Solirubrobacteraceae bacterium]|nr:hypothetical protein [Solirubrobacteraceae bacterium]